MKQVIFLLKSFCILFLSVVSLASCNGMDDTPSGSYLEKDFWTSTEKAQYVLNMAYNQLYSAGRMWRDEKLSDNLAMGRTFTDERIIRNGNADASTWLFDNEWRDCFSAVKTCNVFLDMVDLIKADNAVIKNMKAQARYIRVAMFFRLTCFYGDIPYFTRNITSDEAKIAHRISHKAVIDSLKAELDALVPLLPTKDELATDRRGEVTKGAALMLRARIALYESDWNDVEKYCNMLMHQQDEYGRYSLFDSYSGLFLQENEYNDEVILDCGYAPKMRTWGEMFDMAPLSVGARVNDCAPTQSLVDDYIMLDGRPYYESKMYDSTHPYLDRDPRLTHTVVYDGYDWSGNVNDRTKGKVIYTNPDARDRTDAYAGHNKNQTMTGYYVRKYYDPQHEGHLASAINIIAMRYADVLLMYAEAMNEQGRMSSVVWNETIGALRRRAGFTLPEALDYPLDLSREQMRSVIRRERRSELALEGLRWFDIKRWRTGGQCLDGYVYGAKFENNYTENIRLDNYQFDESRDYLWAVPLSQIDINKNLMPQNPGY